MINIKIIISFTFKTCIYFSESLSRKIIAVFIKIKTNALRAPSDIRI